MGRPSIRLPFMIGLTAQTRRFAICISQHFAIWKFRKLYLSFR